MVFLSTIFVFGTGVSLTGSSVFFFISIFFANISLSINSIIAIGASSPYLNPVLNILLYPPCLFSYLKERIFINLSTEVLSCSFENKSFLDCKLFFFPNVITLSGPSHAEEVIEGHPTTLVSASSDSQSAQYVQQLFSNDRLRVYTSKDIRGVELGGSIKNVVAIAAGFCDGTGYGDNTKAALMTRGIKEISCLGLHLGAKSDTFFGLSGVGDLIVTCSSNYSRNRKVGEEIGRGEILENILAGTHMIPEGVQTALSVHQLSKKVNIEMPICEAVYNVLFKKEDPQKAVYSLMTRDLKPEFLG